MMADEDSTPTANTGEFPQTTMHVARAVNGDATSLEWLVGRLSPLLREHARFRLGSVLRRHYDPDDLVHDAWIATLPKLQELVASPDSRRTPILLKYLSNTVVLRIRYLARRHARQHESTAPADDPGELPAAQSGAVSRAVRGEQRAQLREIMAELESSDREVLLLRGIEQLSAKAVATVLNLGIEAVHKRYQRAVAKLRARLPESVFNELGD